MRQGDELDLERPDGETPRQRHLGDRDLVLQARFDQLFVEKGAGEGCRVNRAAEALPEIGNGADMVFVAMRHDETGEAVAPLDDEAGIGHQHVEARLAVVGEGDAAIDHQPFAAIAVQRQVHADLAGTAEREEDELFGCRHEAALRLWMR